MVALRVFSGLASSPWALASAAAMAPMDSLERCIGRLHIHQVEAHRTAFRPLSPNSVPHGFLGIFWYQFLEIRLGSFVLLERWSGPAIHRGEFCPGVGRVHIYHPDRFQARARRLHPKQARDFAILHATPELLLGRDQ